MPWTTRDAQSIRTEGRAKTPGPDSPNCDGAQDQMRVKEALFREFKGSCFGADDVLPAASTEPGLWYLQPQLSGARLWSSEPTALTHVSSQWQAR
ncbi:unnamed protein product [Arctogadus glacialis]